MVPQGRQSTQNPNSKQKNQNGAHTQGTLASAIALAQTLTRTANRITLQCPRRPTNAKCHCAHCQMGFHDTFDPQALEDKI